MPQNNNLFEMYILHTYIHGPTKHMSCEGQTLFETGSTFLQKFDVGVAI